MAKEKWIALAEIIPTAACSELQQPAVVNVMGLAMDESSFIELIRVECSSMELQPVNVEDAEPWCHRIANWQPEEEVMRLAAAVCENRPFVFGTFYTFNDELN